MKRKVVRTQYVSSLPNNSPAAVNPKTGVLYVNESVFFKLSKSAQAFILEHEKAHLEGNTASELKADQIAFDNYVKKRKSLKGAVAALYEQLSPETNAEHHLRLYQQTVRAFAHDKKLTYQQAELYVNSKVGKSNTTSMNATMYTPSTRAKGPVPASAASAFAQQPMHFFLGKLGNWLKEKNQQFTQSAVGRTSQTVAKGILGTATGGLANSLVKTQDEKDRAAKEAQAAAEAQKAAQLAAESTEVRARASRPCSG